MWGLWTIQRNPSKQPGFNGMSFQFPKKITSQFPWHQSSYSHIMMKGCFFHHLRNALSLGFFSGGESGSPEVEPATDRRQRLKPHVLKVPGRLPAKALLATVPRNLNGMTCRGPGMKLYWSYVFWAVTKTLGWLLFYRWLVITLECCRGIMISRYEDIPNNQAVDFRDESSSLVS